MEEDLESNVGFGGQDCLEVQMADEASQRSAEPVSRIILYATGGVPIASEP